MPGSGQNEVISIRISVPLANAIEGALCVDAISLRGIFLPETSLHCTQAPHVFQLSVLPFYLRGGSVLFILLLEYCAVGICGWTLFVLADLWLLFRVVWI